MTTNQPRLIEARISIAIMGTLEILSLSNGIYNLLGFNTDDFLSGKISLQSRIHADDQDIADELFSPEINKISRTINFRLRHADGKIRCIKGQYTKIKNDDSIVLDLLLQDAKSLWHPSNEHFTQPSTMSNFKAMMDNTDDYIYFKDRNHVFNGASQALVEITESTQHWTEFLGLTDYDVFLETYADIYYSLEKQVFAGANVAHDIQETLLQDGSKGWVNNRKYPIKNDAGEIMGLFGIARDITESKLLTENLELRERHLQAILNSTSDCVKLVSRDGTLVSMNSAGLTLIEADCAEAVINRSVYPIVASEYRTAFQVFNETVCEGKTASMEFEIIGLNGTRRWMESSAVPFQEQKSSEVLHLAFTKEITERKKLELQKEQYFKFFQLSTDPMCIANPHGCFIQLNPAFVRLLGFSETELLERPLLEFVHPEDRERTQMEFQAQIEVRPSMNFENRYVCKDGTVKVLSWNAYYDTCESITYATAHDITKMKQSELSLKNAEATVNSLIRNIPDLVWFKDVKGVYQYCNQRFESFFGKKVAEIIGKSDYDFVGKEQADFFRQRDQVAMAGTVIQINEEWITFADDGHSELLESKKMPIFNSDGQLIGVLGIGHDITERVKMQDELRLKEQYQRILLDNFPFAVWLKDNDSRFLSVNKVFADMFGINNTSTLVGKNDFDITENDLAESYRADDWEVMESGQPKSVEEEILTAGTRKWFETYKAPLIDVNKKIHGIVGFTRDITLRKKSEIELKIASVVFESQEGMLITDENKIILKVNKAFTTITGYSADEAIGKTPSFLSSGRHDAHFFANMWDQINKNGYFEGEIWNKRKNEEIYPQRFTITAVLNNEGQVGNYIGTMIDITATKQQELQRIANEATHRDTLVREVHHRIKNNLQGVSNLLGNFAGKHPDLADPMNEAISQVQSIAVTYGLMGHSALLKVYLCELIKDIAYNHQTLWKIPIKVDIPVQWIPYQIVEADAVPIALVLNELIANAVKHGCYAKGVNITLRQKPLLNILQVTITNTGQLSVNCDYPNIPIEGTGLQLLKSLLPVDGAALSWEQCGDKVHTRLDLGFPVILQEQKNGLVI
jgi:PAS domain S-box-containing protein